MNHCAYCNDTIKHKRKIRFCSNECRELAYKHPFSGLSTGTVGAAGELLATVDMIAKGYEVFRAVSPSTSCDLIALKDGKLYRVEVRTGLPSTNGTINYPKKNIRADMVAIVSHQKDKTQIIYENLHTKKSE